MGVKRLSDIQTVFELDTLDGHQFEDAIYDLFSREGYQVEMGARTNDKGRDLIVRSNSHTIVVECKHYIGSVGRPVVQKLHSSVQTFGENASGLLITTGSFTQESIEYAEEIQEKTNVLVELIDFKALAERGKRVGLYFVSSKRGNAAYFQIPWRTEIKGEWNEFVAGIKSHPRRSEDAIALKSASQIFYPLFWCDYALEKSFQTSVATLHVARDRGTVLYAANLSPVSADEATFWQSVEPAELQESSIANKHPSAFFGSQIETCLSSTSNAVAQRNSARVRYTGRNNQHYSKDCIVQEKDVRVSGRHVLVSKWHITFAAGSRDYELELADRAGLPLGLLAQKGFELGTSGAMNSSLLCNDCALIVPIVPKSDYKPLGSACSDCGRTLCREHYFRLFRWEILPPRMYCSSCYPDPLRLTKSWNFYPWFLIASLTTLGLEASGRPILDLDINILAAIAVLFSMLYLRRLGQCLLIWKKLRNYVPSWVNADVTTDAGSQHDQMPRAADPSVEKISKKHPRTALAHLLLWTPIIVSLILIACSGVHFPQFASAENLDSGAKTAAVHGGRRGTAQHSRKTRRKLKTEDSPSPAWTDIPAP